MSTLIKTVCNTVGDFRFSSEEGNKLNQSFNEIAKHISHEGAVQLIVDYGCIDNARVNNEIYRIFQSEAWASPLTSPINQLVWQRFKSSITSLVIPANSEKYLCQIAMRIVLMPALRTVTMQTATQGKYLQTFIGFYQKILKQNQAIRVISCASATLSELNAITVAQPLLEELSTSSLSREHQANEKTQKATVSQVATRLTRLKGLRLNSAQLTNDELTTIVQVCTGITRLEVAGNLLNRDVFPIIVAALKSLNTLDISGMNGLQLSDLDSLLPLPLRSLSLRACFPESNGLLVASLARLSLLDTLDISDIELNAEDLSNLATFRKSNLKILIMRSCFQIRHSKHSLYAQAIGNIESLEELDILHCKIREQDLKEITKPQNLRKFFCGHWIMRDDPQGKGFECPELEKQKISDGFKKEIAALKKNKPHLIIIFEEYYDWITLPHPSVDIETNSDLFES